MPTQWDALLRRALVGLRTYRDSGFKPRDIFDTAVVLSSPYGEALRSQLSLISGSKGALLDRIGGIADSYFNAVLNELEIHPDWQWIIPKARQIVSEMVKDIPAS